ncbi:MAG: FtsK/SpoIIIE domain-containing protein [Neisseria sp.]|nr:FtsK/SpoIIIE domain-containing protein [Neisseria sp.]
MYQLEHNAAWDTDYFHTLMSEKRIISSKEAKDIRDKLMDAGALPPLDSNFDWAMLCIGYCFAKGFTESANRLLAAPNAKGTEIPSFQTCFQDYSRLWLVLLSETLFHINPGKAVSKDDLYTLIQSLWHTGAVELEQFWEGCKRFKPDSDLEARQAFLNELTDLAVKNSENRQVGNIEDSNAQSLEYPPEEMGTRLTEALKNLHMGAVELKFLTSGIRYDFYRVRFANYQEWGKFHTQLCSALGFDSNRIIAERCTKNNIAHAYDVKILRDEKTWKPLSKQIFQTALSTYQGDMLLPLCVGSDEVGKPVFEDLVEARHILVGGTTGAGKSVMVRTLLHSLFELVGNDELEVAVLDPANDYAVFKDKSNLWGNCIYGKRDEMRGLLEEFVAEMDKRLELLKVHDVANVYELKSTLRPQSLVIMVEELAALLDNDKETERPLVQLLQEGRKTGIHLIMATQEPDSKTFSARLRANIPSRIAMRVSKPGSSEMILGELGAEKLVGKGDHLVRWNNGKAQFLHGYNV